MKTTALFFCLFLSILTFAKDDNGLVVEQDGLIVEVLHFEEGDKLKLFEVETGDHILSKSYSRIDLSQLPVGSYLLENNQGKSIVIDRLEEELMIERTTALKNDSASNTEYSDSINEVNNVAFGQEIDVEEEVVQHYVNLEKKLLPIIREGDVITVINFEEGDTLKLFEVQDTIHVLSKTTNVIDLSQLPEGMYVLENSKGDAVVVEKFTGNQSTITEM